MRVAVMTTLAGLMLLLAGASWGQTWSEYRSEEGNLRIEMPGLPKLNTAAIPIGNNETAPMVEAQMATRQAAYQVSYISYPRRIGQSAATDVLLDNFRNKMAAGSSYRSEKQLTLGRFPGREFVVVEPNGRNTAVRLYWVRGRLYQLMVTGGAGIETNPDARRFLESFALLTT